MSSNMAMMMSHETKINNASIWIFCYLSRRIQPGLISIFIYLNSIQTVVVNLCEFS